MGHLSHCQQLYAHENSALPQLQKLQSKMDHGCCHPTSPQLKTPQHKVMLRSSSASGLQSPRRNTATPLSQQETLSFRQLVRHLLRLSATLQPQGEGWWGTSVTANSYVPENSALPQLQKTLELWNSPPWFTLNNSLPPARLLLSYFRVRPNFWIITEIGSQLMVLFL